MESLDHKMRETAAATVKETVRDKVASIMPSLLTAHLPDVVNSMQLEKLKEYNTKKQERQGKMETFRANRNWQLTESHIQGFPY